MQAVGRVVPALPVSLVSTAMLEAGENPLSLLDIKQRVSGLIGELEGRAAMSTFRAPTATTRFQWVCAC
jgi:hypothetical protein